MKKNIFILVSTLLFMGFFITSCKIDLEKKAPAYADIAGRKIAKCCSPSPTDVKIDYNGYSLMKNGRLKIDMVVNWKNSITGCHFSLYGFLYVDKNGCNPDFRKEHVDAPGIGCIYDITCLKRCKLPECLE